MNPHDDDDFESRKYENPSQGKMLTEEEKWLLNYLNQLFSQNAVFTFLDQVDGADLDDPTDDFAPDAQVLLQSLQAQDALVQGDDHAWALSQIMSAYHKHQ